MEIKQQLISYIAPGAPATRRPASGYLPFLRPEIGFTPKWYRSVLGIDFGEQWHTDPNYRRQTRIEMYIELNKRFSETPIGYVGENTIDLLTGTYGASAIAAIYGIPIRYNEEQWPTSEHQYLSKDELENLTPPDLDQNAFFLSFMEQVAWIGEHEGKIAGYMNWQGVLNNAQRLRGQDIFMDMYMVPERTKHLLDCVCTTMIEAAERLQQEQKRYDDTLSFFTVSNCLVNMVNPGLYEEFLLPFDQKIAAAFEVIGIHNCAWSATPYLEHYAKVPGVAYIDMGIDSDLEKARTLFPEPRRAIMYTPMDVANKTISQIWTDLEQIAQNYGPCDIVAADIEAGTPDSRVTDFIKLCDQISGKFQKTNHIKS
ncbi:MAG: uroporphyrinogen decarboxylase family protein [Bacteroidales bacterium]|nr:uroporphyrinogen decarboxylase family protein [Bacteroidales bacterium]